MLVPQAGELHPALDIPFLNISLACTGGLDLPCNRAAVSENGVGVGGRIVRGEAEVGDELGKPMRFIGNIA
jgi:hypothetical protein